MSSVRVCEVSGQMGQALEKSSAESVAPSEKATETPAGNAHEMELITLGRMERGAPVLLVLTSARSGSQADGMSRRDAIASLWAPLLDRYRVIAPGAPLPEVNAVDEYTKRLTAALEAAGVKRLTLLGTGPGASVAQALGVALPGIVRRVLLVDPTARITPTFATRIIDRLERFFPTGLPLRTLGDEFDSMPTLHRLRCPVLILLSTHATYFEQSQARIIARRAPNARLQKMRTSLFDNEGRFGSELLDSLETFNTTPAKRSQKPVGSEE